MELGADGILLNTAVSGQRPCKMAEEWVSKQVAYLMRQDVFQLNILHKHLAQLKDSVSYNVSL